MMDGKIRGTYEQKESYEFSLDWNGNNFLIVYGRHINGWFIAMPNWNTCTEAGHPHDTFYNAEKLFNCIRLNDAPTVIANAIKKDFDDREVY